MADLLVWQVDGVEALVESPDFRSLRLYCWPCRTVHGFLLPDVERLVAGFAGVVAELLSSGILPILNSDPPCLLEVLDRAATGDLFQFVDLAIDNRTAATHG